MRRIQAVIGNPRIVVRLRPAMEYGAQRPEVTHGSNHIRYVIPNATIRLTTDVPVSFVLKEVPFIVEQPMTLFLGPDETLSGGIEETGRDFVERTIEFWRDWCRGLSIPFEWQEEVIRAAITLKLCTFEESGAVIAALTTSIPEAPGSQRNWDYRYCWLRDAYFVVHALNAWAQRSPWMNISGISPMWRQPPPTDICSRSTGITLDARLTERSEPNLSGYRGDGPVRVGNQAFEHIQNDVYGSVIMAATQMFFDVRMAHPGTGRMFERLEAIGEQAVLLYNEPDAGIWESGPWRKSIPFRRPCAGPPATGSPRVAAHLRFSGRAEYWQDHADRMHKEISAQAWNKKLNSFVDCFGGEDLDASLLLLQHMGFVEATDPRFVGTVEAIEKYLKRGDFLLRYAASDDFGTPDNAFTVCTFWYIDALAAIGRRDEARTLFEKILSHRNHVGLLSEDLDPKTGELWGNFPQTYSMVGLITSATKLSKSWEEAF